MILRGSSVKGGPRKQWSASKLLENPSEAELKAFLIS